jgi:xanthine dehydrogenase accessory factor
VDLFEEIVKMRRAGRRGALATIVHTNGSIPSYESSRMLVREDGSIAGTIGGGCVEAEVWAASKEVMQKESPRKMVFNLNNEASYDNGLICGGTLEVFVEPILPQPLLYLFGGGHVSTAVAKAAQAAGFGISVVDDREAFANKERFPLAQEIYTSYEDAFEKIHPNASSYLVIVTRGHKDDMRVLAWAVRTEARYVGMIGSKRKVLSVYKALENEGYKPEEFERVFAPMGLEIGALSPEEIAISIVAELVAVRRGAATAAHKKLKHEAHAPVVLQAGVPTGER